VSVTRATAWPPFLTLAAVGALVFFGSRATERLAKAFKRFNKHAYAQIPDDIDTPTPPASPTLGGIVPVVERRLELRQNPIIALYAAVALSLWLADGAVFAVRALVKQEWEGDLPQYRFMLVYILLMGTTYAGCCLAMAKDRTSGRLKRSWKSRYPSVLVAETLAGEIALMGVFATWILHIAFLALRILLLLLLLFSFSRFMKRSRYISAANGNGYGTFQGSAAASEVKVKSENQSITLKIIVERVTFLFPYLWPKKSKPLQLIAVICLVILALGRVVNLLVPIMLGRIVSSLGSGASQNAWRDLAFYIALKFMQGNGGILQVIQNCIWIPVSQNVLPLYMWALADFLADILTARCP
jgi:hypothetical protein